MRRLILAAVVNVLLVLISCGHESERINVLVIGVDTLRPDHLGCYGYFRETSPRIDSLAAEEEAMLPSDLAFAESISQGPELKCIVRYPWKIVYNMVTQEKHLFRLDTDPGEHKDAASTEPDILISLESILFPTLFRLSETWYVELAGGSDGHRFDLIVKARRDPGIGRIHPYVLLDRTGRIVDVPRAITEKASGSILELSLTDLTTACTLAFQVSPTEFPIELDIKIDGRQAINRIHLGKDLSTPENLPTAFKGKRRRVTCPYRPTGELDLPYVLIWLDESEYVGDILVDHDDNTKEEFRALGYIQ